METKVKIIEPLLERVEQYSKTSLELLKLKSIDKTADIASSLFSRLILVIVLAFFTFTLNIGLALWLGELLGKDYLGFIVVAGFYGLVSIIVYYIHPSIKSKFSNSIITNMLN